MSAPGTKEARLAVANLRIQLGRTNTNVKVNGVRLSVDISDRGVCLPLYIDREYEPIETTFILNTLRPEMTFMDVGANIGYYTVLAARILGETGKVISIEPESRNFDLLRRNVEINHLTNCRLFQMGLGSRIGNARIYTSSINFGDHRVYDSGDTRGSQEVSIKTGDAVLKEVGVSRVDMIKMDVQGFETQVLEGLTETLERNQQLIVLTEFWPDGMRLAGGDPEKFLHILEKAGFEVALLNKNAVEEKINYEDVMGSVPEYNPNQPDSNYLNLVFRKMNAAS